MTVTAFAGTCILGAVLEESTFRGAPCGPSGLPAGIVVQSVAPPSTASAP